MLKEALFNDFDSNCINIIYQVSEKISEGSFGYVFKGVNLVTKQNIAIKIEKHSEKARSSLARETKYLRHLQNIEGIPEIFWYGRDKNLNVKAMVLQYLGKSLEDRLNKQQKFSLKTVVYLAEKLIEILKNIHSRGILHRDIKPGNILLGQGKNYKNVYLIDFGISKSYLDKRGEHIILTNFKPFIGTLRFSSEAAHLGLEISRKDELESLGYTLLYMFKGNLPWMNQKFKLDEKRVKIGEIKGKISIDNLCLDCPSVFALYFKYIRNLGFYDEPNYDYLKNLFATLGKSLNTSSFIANSWDLKSRSKSTNNSICLDVPKTASSAKVKPKYKPDEYEPGITERPGILFKMNKLNNFTNKNNNSFSEERKKKDVFAQRKSKTSKSILIGLNVNNANTVSVADSRTVFSGSKSYVSDVSMSYVTGKKILDNLSSKF